MRRQLTQHNVFLSSACNLSCHLSVGLGQQFEHALYLLVLVRWKSFEFTNTNINHSNSFPFPISEGKGHVTLAVRICSDGLWALYTFEQVVPKSNIKENSLNRWTIVFSTFNQTEPCVRALFSITISLYRVARNFCGFYFFGDFCAFSPRSSKKVSINIFSAQNSPWRNWTNIPSRILLMSFILNVPFVQKQRWD